MERVGLRQWELYRCEARLRKEKQSNCKVSINVELRDPKHELEGLIQ